MLGARKRSIIDLNQDTNKNERRYMLELKRTSVHMRNVAMGTKNFVRGLIFGGTVLFLSHAAFATAVINSISYSFKVATTNSGVEPNALGTVSGSLMRRGATDNQGLKITVSKLNTNTTYHLVAFLDGSAAATNVADFTTDRRGGSSITYANSTHPGGQPLPAAVDPITNLRELDIVNTNGTTVMQADMTDPISFSYSVKRAMVNTGFLTGAGGVLQLRGSSRATTASVTATGLTQLASFQLLVNGSNATTKSSNRRGNLALAGPKAGLPLALDIRTVALADGTGTNIILITTGLGIPGVLSTNSDTNVIGPAVVVLGAATSYAVLAGSTVTSINATAVKGDLGASPGTAVTGFPPGAVNGTMHAGDSAAAQAQLDLTTA